MSGIVSFLLLFCSLNISISFTQTVNDTNYDANFLLQLGHDFNNNLLQLIGQALLNTETSLVEIINARDMEILNEQMFLKYVCISLECGDWSEWSQCSAEPGTYMFGMTKRTRPCGHNNSLCSYPTRHLREETETNVSESIPWSCLSSMCITTHAQPWNSPSTVQRTCPTSYELIDQTFCLRFVSIPKMKIDASKICRDEGAEIVNINTPQKSSAVQKLLYKVSFKDNIFINGQRMSRDDPWEYTYGGEPTFYNWATAEPSRGITELCKVEGGIGRKWWDRECDKPYNTVCEIVLDP